MKILEMSAVNVNKAPTELKSDGSLCQITNVFKSLYDLVQAKANYSPLSSVIKFAKCDEITLVVKP